jgi:zeaxanthin glucosyltransferase
MRTIGILCQPLSGHLNPMLALGVELQRRGHRVIVLNCPDAAEAVQRAGLDFAALGAATFPLGTVADAQRSLRELSVVGSARFAMRWLIKLARVILEEAPAIIRAERIDSLLIDMAECASPTLADGLGLPYVAVSNTLSMNEPGVPAVITAWQPNSSWPWRLRDGAVGAAGDAVFHYRVGRWLNGQRARLGLTPHRKYADHWTSALAQLSQYPAAFDFPRACLPDVWHAVGPLRAETEPWPFPFDRLDGRALVFASLGTLQGGRRSVFGTIAEACAPLGVQLVITHGHQLRDEDTRGFAGDPLVVPYAPQRALLARASLAITQAGMNTVLDALSAAVPIVAIPLAFEQPGIAARITWHRAGETIRLRDASVTRIRAAAARVLQQPHYREAAAKLSRAIAAGGGVGRAAEVTEQAFITGQPVLAMAS